MKRKGILFVLSGPSGAGKGTVLKGVFHYIKDLGYSISATTRKARNDEIDGNNYFFISDEKFEKMIENNEFLEYVDKFGNRYGTIKKYVDDLLNNGTDVILEIETEGAQNVRRLEPNHISIFITPSSANELVKRLQGRNTETLEWQQKRLAIGIEEIKSSYNYDYIVLNDNLYDAIDDVTSIIRAERCKVVRNIEKIENIIKK